MDCVYPVCAQDGDQRDLTCTGMEDVPDGIKSLLSFVKAEIYERQKVCYNNRYLISKRQPAELDASDTDKKERGYVVN